MSLLRQQQKGGPGPMGTWPFTASFDDVPLHSNKGSRAFWKYFIQVYKKEQVPHCLFLLRAENVVVFLVSCPCPLPKNWTSWGISKRKMQMWIYTCVSKDAIVSLFLGTGSINRKKKLDSLAWDVSGKSRNKCIFGSLSVLCELHTVIQTSGSTLMGSGKRNFI
jgi:hypothetical protein